MLASPLVLRVLVIGLPGCHEPAPPRAVMHPPVVPAAYRSVSDIPRINPPAIGQCHRQLTLGDAPAACPSRHPTLVRQPH